MSEKSINTRKINTRKIITWEINTGEINTGEIDVSEISAGIITKKGGKPMKPDKKFPLFIVSGASGVGKSTMCEILFKKETDYIVLESDILWQEVFNTPQDNYRNFREVWMTMCANVSQIGMPVVLCGCGIPEQFEPGLHIPHCRKWQIHSGRFHRNTPEAPSLFSGQRPASGHRVREACPSCPHRKRAGKARQVFCKYH